MFPWECVICPPSGLIHGNNLSAPENHESPCKTNFCPISIHKHLQYQFILAKKSAFLVSGNEAFRAVSVNITC